MTRPFVIAFAILGLWSGCLLAAPLSYKIPEETAAFKPGPDLDLVRNNCTACHSADYIKTQKLRALAVTTAERMPDMPEIPPVGDFVKGYEAIQWYGLAAPKNTPAEIIDKLNKEINAILVEPKAKARFAELSAAVMPGAPADFGKHVADETEKWAKVIKDANVELQ